MSNYFGKNCTCTYHCEDCDPTWPNKGKKDGRCNRAVCDQIVNVIFYNHSTQLYYCFECAIAINTANRPDAIRLYGHQLCLTDDKLTPDEFITKQFKKETHESNG